MYYLPLKIKKYIHKNSFDIAWEEKTKKYKFSVISVFSFWALHPKTKTQKSRKFYKNTIILYYEDVASKHLKYVQMTSNSKWFNRITDHKAGIWLLRVSNLSRFIEFVFPNAIFDTQKVKIVIIKQVHMYFSFITQK